jgi:hypothetical protein
MTDFWQGALAMCAVMIAAALGYLYVRHESWKRRRSESAEWTEPEWCVVLEGVFRRLFDAKREFSEAYACASEMLVKAPEHLRPIVAHQLQLAQIHEKVIARALAKQGLAVETLFGDPEVASMSTPVPVELGRRVPRSEREYVGNSSPMPTFDDEPSGEFEVSQLPSPKTAWSRRRRV